jgi:hypothetical protein
MLDAGLILMPGLIWYDMIRVDLKEVWEGANSTRLSRDTDRWRAVVTSALGVRIP